jgi:hypothetical protein
LIPPRVKQTGVAPAVLSEKTIGGYRRSGFPQRLGGGSRQGETDAGQAIARGEQRG